MKKSTEIYTELQQTLAKIRTLSAETDTNQPIRREWRLTQAENDENYRRSRRLDRIGAEIRQATSEASALRKQYSEAMAAEQRAPAPAETTAKSTSEIPKLRKQIAECEKFLADLPDSKRPHVLPAARGDKKALDALDKIAAAEQKARDTIALSTAAIAEIEAQNAETQREFNERRADECHRAGLAAADAIVSWAEDFDVKLQAIAEHFAKLPDLQKALAKSGASINTDLTNRIYTAASRDRAAKAAHLHRVFSIDATVTATPLGEAFKSLLRAAVRRPDVKGKAA
jgi:hypothetical protein